VRTWQIFAAIAALALVASAVRLLLSSRKPSQVAFLVLLVPIPVAGFVLYVFVPSQPLVTVVTLVTSLLIVLAAYPGVWGWRAGDRWRSATVTAKDITFVNRYVLARRACVLLGVDGYLFVFEPWFAIANLAAIVAWVAIWIPARTRTRQFELSGVVRATPEATFAFLVEPSNWIRYRNDLEDVRAEPDGPLAFGTELTIRRPMPDRATQGSAPPKSYQERLRITVLTGSSFRATFLDRAAVVATDLHPTEAGTTITGRSEWVIPFTDAVLGLGLEERVDIEAGRESLRRNYQRLNELVAQER
jgi:hypothetical protein